MVYSLSLAAVNNRRGASCRTATRPHWRLDAASSTHVSRRQISTQNDEAAENGGRQPAAMAMLAVIEAVCASRRRNIVSHATYDDRH